jgi:hypothetical protein
MMTRCFCPIRSLLKNNLALANIISPIMSGKGTAHEFQLQKNTLRFLCSVLIKSGTRSEICKLLDPIVFDDPLHRVVFEEIREMGSIDSRRLRELLPARVTNRGFPDFDLNELLAPREVTEKEIDQLFESALQLLDLSHPDQERLVD